MDRCTHTSPLIDIQPPKTRISMFKRTRIARITRTKGRVSQSLRGVALLIAYELHEYHPDGIRVIRL